VALLLAGIGPAVVAAAWTSSAAIPAVAGRLIVLAALTLTGGALPAGLGAWAPVLDARRRRVDPRFGHP
jgi:hypothetical protein